MELKAICRYQSRHNDVHLVRTENGIFVLKQYRQEESWQKELQIYRKLLGSGLPHGEVLRAEPLQISLSHLPGENLVEVLERQETTGVVDWAVWDKLADWLMEFYRLTGLVMQDVNLRNFLYDDNTKTLYGLDFEECGKGDPLSMAALLAAFIRTYAPENTPLKQEFSDYVLRSFSRKLGISFRALTLETKKQEAFLRRRRNCRT